MGSSDQPFDDHADSDSPILQAVGGVEKNIGSFTVRRTLPSLARRSLGPFVFMDHMGPAVLEPGAAVSVRPHPHINLATVTYLFEGEITHRDSLGNTVTIRPGAINLMTAGKGIAHSERSPTHTLDTRRNLHGLQLWCALSIEDEECNPAFEHYPAERFVPIPLGQGSARVLLGKAFGVVSPVATSLPTLLAELRMLGGQTEEIELEAEEWGIYVISGSVHGNGAALPDQKLILFRESKVNLEAHADTLIVLLGGQKLAEPRHMYWNFISTRKERIEQAKSDWQNNGFDPVVDDNEEFIPLPD